MSNTCITEFIITGTSAAILSLGKKMEEACRVNPDVLYNAENVCHSLKYNTKKEKDLRANWSNVRIKEGHSGPTLFFIEESAWKPLNIIHRLLGTTCWGDGINRVYTRSSDWDQQLHFTDDETGEFFPEPFAFYCKGDLYRGFCNSLEDAMDWCQRHHPAESFDRKDFVLETVERGSNRPLSIMEYMYGILSNKCELQKIDESCLNELLSKHRATGFLILKADLPDRGSDVNKESVRNLINDVRKFGASYFPLYCAHQSKEDVFNYYEATVIVTAFSPGQELIDFNKMREFAAEMRDKYGSDAATVVAPNENVPTLIEQNGGNLLCFPKPTTLNESYRRSSFGEIMHI